MSSYTINKFDHVQTVGDIVSGGAIVVDRRLYVGDLILQRTGHGLQCFQLKPKIPEKLSSFFTDADRHPAITCEDYFRMIRK